MRLRVRVGDRHQDREAGALRARREPLAPVDHPLVAVAHGPRLQPGRVRPGHVRLGHGEERPDLARNERTQPRLLLLVRAEQVQDLAVARVRRLAAEDELGPDAAPDLLVQVRVGEEPLPGPARLGRQVRCPQTVVPRPRPQLLHQPLRRVVLAVERGLGRVDVLLHESAVAVAQLVEARRWS